MKKITIGFIIILITFLVSCSKSNSEITFENLNISGLKPEDTYNQFPRDNQLSSNNNVWLFNMNSVVAAEEETPLDPEVTINENGFQVLNLDKGSFFTMIIDVNNPNERSIHEIKIKNTNNGDTTTYQPGQMDDLDGNGSNEVLFYVNQGINRIYLGIKIPHEFESDSIIKYEIESITYLNDGAVDYVQFPKGSLQQTQINIISLPFAVNILSDVVNDSTVVVLNDVSGNWGTAGIVQFDFTIILFNEHSKEVNQVIYILGDQHSNLEIYLLSIGEESSNFEIDYGDYNSDDCTVISFELENTRLSKNANLTYIANFEDSNYDVNVGTQQLYFLIQFTDGTEILLDNNYFTYDVLIFIEE